MALTRERYYSQWSYPCYSRRVHPLQVRELLVDLVTLDRADHQVVALVQVLMPGLLEAQV